MLIINDPKTKIIVYMSREDIYKSLKKGLRYIKEI